MTLTLTCEFIRDFSTVYVTISSRKQISAIVFLPRDACISAVYAVVRCLSVRALRSCSVCIVTGKHILKLFSPSGSHTAIVFHIKPYDNIPTRTSNLGKNRNLRPIYCLLVECRVLFRPRSMLIMGSVDFVYNSRLSRRKEQNRICLCVLVHLKPK